MNALELNRYTAAWRAFGAAVPRLRAIVVVSAHWYINATAVTAMAHPRTIHDFYGFPRNSSTYSIRPLVSPSWPRR
jgi:4,5-DOPA dioxygenase extradiol